MKSQRTFRLLPVQIGELGEKRRHYALRLGGELGRRLLIPNFCLLDVTICLFEQGADLGVLQGLGDVGINTVWHSFGLGLFGLRLLLLSFQPFVKLFVFR